jgi:hypothetical protein
VQRVTAAVCVGAVTGEAVSAGVAVELVRRDSHLICCGIECRLPWFRSANEIYVLSKSSSFLFLPRRVTE